MFSEKTIKEMTDKQFEIGKLVLGFLFTLLFLTASNATFAQDFTSEQDGFSVWFPAEPEFSISSTDSAVGKVQIRQYTVTNNTGIFTVSINEFPVAVKSGEEKETVFDGARDALVRKMKADILLEKEISRNGAIGRETIFTTKSINCRHFMFLENVNFYQVLFCGTGTNYKSQNANKFFDSFELIAEKGADDTIADPNRPASQISGLLEKGMQQVKNENYVAAAATFSEVLKINPNHEGATFFRGLARYELKQYNLAVADFGKSLQLTDKPNLQAESYYYRGLALTRLARNREAVSDYTKAISLKTGFWQAYFNRGTVHFNTGNTNAALLDYSKVIELKPDYAVAYKYRADCYDKLKRPELARKDRAKAASLE